MSEFRSLTTLWLAELPFGLVAMTFAPMNIRQYEIAFSSNITWHGSKNIRSFSILVLNLNKVSSTKGLRSLVLPGEEGIQRKEGKDFKESCAVVTTWEWDVKENPGSFWFVEASMQKMVEEGWAAMIFRDDNMRCAQSRLSSGKDLQSRRVGARQKDHQAIEALSR